eukprot:Nk52_evm4s266 gene=Nk52_evmTU4s266
MSTQTTISSFFGKSTASANNNNKSSTTKKKTENASASVLSTDANQNSEQKSDQLASASKGIKPVTKNVPDTNTPTTDPAKKENIFLNQQGSGTGGGSEQPPATKRSKFENEEQHRVLATGDHDANALSLLLKGIKCGGTVKEDDYDATKERKDYDAILDACWKAGEPVPYYALARVFEEVEKTTKRLKITEIVVNLLRSVIILTPDDLIPCIYLCLNRLAPQYEGVELGIGDTILMKAIGETTGRSLKSIKDEMATIGDLGEIAESSRGNQMTMFKPKPLTVRGVFTQLLQIAKITGNSSQQRKSGKIKGILVGCRGSEARYIVRSLSGKLRIGLAEQSVLVAIGQAFSICHAWDGVKALRMVIDKKKDEEGKKILQNFGLQKLPSSSRKMEDVVAVSALETAVGAIKTAFCELPSYDRIVPVVLKHIYDDSGVWLKQLEEDCSLTPGIPLKPMLAHPTKGVSEVLKRFENMSFTCEFKYDGERAQVHMMDDGKQTIKIFSRNQEDNTSKYPDITSRIHKSFNYASATESETKDHKTVSSFILDCEAVAYDVEKDQILPFQVLSTRKRKDADVETIKVQVCLFAFDLLYLNGKSMVREPLGVRRDALRLHFQEVPGEFLFAKGMDGTKAEEIEEFLEVSIQGNCEGLMVKTIDADHSTYEIAKRSHNWLKVKKDYLEGVGDTLDLVVIGGFTGKGKRTGGYGGFLLGCYDADNDEFQSICKIGTGFSDEDLQTHSAFFSKAENIVPERKSYVCPVGESVKPDVWFDIVQVWEVKAADLSISPVHRAAAGMVDPEKGISLRFPRFIRIREDKRPEDATTAAQVAEMYRNQQQNTAQLQEGFEDEDFY